VVLLASRMLWNKGVADFVKAATLLREQGVTARFVLVGDIDSGSPSGLPRNTLVAWHDSGVIEWWGLRQSMAEVYRSATLVCLPSHGGEGVPKVLLEAAACGRAIVTTDVPGCRDIVQDNVNGLLIPAKDPSALAKSIRYLLDHHEIRSRMGAAGREVALGQFSQDIVVRKTLALYSDLAGTEFSRVAQASSIG
jgi:glycosyltransferase involved in cell wall biosynthesis